MFEIGLVIKFHMAEPTKHISIMYSRVIQWELVPIGDMQCDEKSQWRLSHPRSLWTCPYKQTYLEEIPQNSHGLTIPESAYIGNAGLCGRPLNKSCPGDESSYEDPNSRVDGNNVTKGGESEDDRFITEGFYITLGLGFVVGFWGILGTILLNNRFRHAFFKQLDTIGDLVCVRIELNKARLQRHFQNRRERT
ncbi:UNVERIFIED_CONTAM: hypothetical protein Scaly_0441100 [Sesamum calycinum]|uniref:Uncharacterized protein n=1 Tax=Sesamum calycinum TaxID=2727403 RepID=A0AAW2SFK1_9LAMI